MSLLNSLETLPQHSSKMLWRCTTETSWWHSAETSLGVSFETYLQRHCDVQTDVVTTLPRRLVAGWVRSAARSILNLKYSVPKKISIVFQNGSNYDYHFIIKELAK